MSSSELAFNLSAKIEALTLKVADINKQYILHEKIYLFERLALSVVWRWRNFYWTDGSVSCSVGSKLCGWIQLCRDALQWWYLNKFRMSWDLIHPVNCYLQCLINALFSAFSFIIMVVRRFCIGGIELLWWLKFWPLASQLWNTSPTAVAKKSTACHVLRVLVICKRQCNKLHGAVFMNDTLFFKSDSW